MDILIPVNLGISFLAFCYCVYIAYKNKHRRNLRLLGALLSAYVFFTYFWVVTGVIAQSQIPLFLRWTQSAFMVYIISEGRNNNV